MSAFLGSGGGEQPVQLQAFSPVTAVKELLLTSEVELMRKRALVRLARPSMFMVPRKLVLMVLMGLYLQQAHTAW